MSTQDPTRARRSYGTGSLIEKTDRAGRATWYGKWRTNGRQVMRRVGIKRTKATAEGLTKAQAEERLRELIATTTAPRGDRQSLTIERLHDRYLADRGRRLKATTTADYRAITRNHLTPYFRDRDLATIAKDDVDGFVGHLIGLGLRPKSVELYVTYLATLLNYAIERDWLDRSPARGVTLPEDPDDVDELRVLEVIEVHDLLAKALPGPYQQIDRALYATAAMAGLRQGECLGLLWRAVDIDAARLRVEENVVRGRRTTPKSRHRRSVPLSPGVAEELLALREESRWTSPTSPVFADPISGKPLARTPLMRRYREALTDANLDPTFRFHDLRHTFGTTIARAGVPVGTIQAWMGHADLRTTERYMHYAPAHDEAQVVGEAFAVADPRVTKASPEVAAISG